jgi:hypothetical protein
MARKKTRKKSAKKPHSFFKALFWIFCFLALLLTLDQLALRLRTSTPLLQELQSDYREFRSRLFGKTPQKPLTIEAVINADATPPVKNPQKVPPQKPLKNSTKAPRPQPRMQKKTADPAADKYLYVDADGELQFADGLEEIPAALRSGAQPLKD